MMRRRIYTHRLGFALPSILLASFVMLAVLITGVSAATTTRNSLEAQRWDILAREAAESGLAYAKACLDQNNLTITWSDATPLKPETNCSGAVQVDCATTPQDTRCGVQNNASYRVTFEVKAPAGGGTTRYFTSTGKVERLRKSNGAVFATYEYASKQAVTQRIDPNGDRANQSLWFFGANAGLNFGTSGTTVTPIDATCAATCTAGEGSTVATDTSGNLLFWTNGLTIWNRLGQVMVNSSGLNANNSTTQATAFFPLGNDGTKYAVITNNAEHGVTNEGELSYSVIDMTLDNGRGAVTTKNQALWPGQLNYSSEALTAAPKSDGSGYWVVTFRPGTTNLIVFSFDINGPVPGGVQEFSSGTSISRYSTTTGYGTLNFNRDFSKLLVMAGEHCTGADLQRQTDRYAQALI